MENVKVKRNDLLSKLEANRDKHRSLFLKAQDGYRALVIKELDKSLEDARNGGAIRTVISMQAPQDHTDEYDNVIAMLRMSVDDVIELDSHSFQCYVMDKWTWAQAAAFLNSTYAAAR